MRKPKVTVIVPCYNCAGVIEAALESVRRQSFRDFEIVVVDDGSTDDSAKRVERIALLEPRLRLMRQTNAGVSSARNRGVGLAQGDLLAFLDGDDLWEETYLEENVARFDADPSLGLSFCRVRFVDMDGRATGQVSRPKLKGLTPQEMLATNPCTSGSNLFVRRRAFDAAGPFDEDLRRAEDQEWLFRLSLTGWKIEGFGKLLVSYRTNDKGLSSDLDAMLAAYNRMLQKARRFAPELVDRNAAIASARMSRYLARRALRFGYGLREARRHLWRGMKTSPWLLVKEPKQTLVTIVASCVPGSAQLFERYRKFDESLRSALHA